MNSKYSSRSNKFYCWGPKGKSQYIKTSQESFEISWIIAFSKHSIRGFIGKEGTCDSQVFVYFLNQMNNVIDNKYLIVADNASIHKSEPVANFIKKNFIWLMTIPPYSPHLNPWEKLILQVKQKMRAWAKKDKISSLKMIQTILNKISNGWLHKWIKDSRIETLNLLHLLD